jgi:hypothetical protein
MAEPLEFVYRAMVEEHGRPRIGTTATTLGIREMKDIEVDDSGHVHRPDFRRGAANGLSCTPSIAELPLFALPEEWGGTNRRTRVWRLRLADLEDDLVAETDAPGHVSIGPARAMPSDEFRDAVHETGPLWQLVRPDVGEPDEDEEPE